MTPIDGKLAEIKQRRQAVISEIIELEKSSTHPDDENKTFQSLDADAVRLLGGIKAKADAGHPNRLRALYRERDVIDRALEIGIERSAMSTAFAAALAGLGVKLPLTCGRNVEAGIVYGADKKPVAVVDVDRGRSDRTAQAIAKLIAEAVNARSAT